VAALRNRQQGYRQRRSQCGPHAWIQEEIQDVGDKIHEDEADGSAHDDTLDHRVVPRENRVDDEFSEAGYCENLLGKDCTREQFAKQKGAQGHDGKQRVTEGMFQDNDAFPQSFCPGRADIVSAQDSEHCRTRVAHQCCSQRSAEDKGRHDHGLKGSDRIDERRFITGCRKPSEIDRNKHDQHDAQPEVRYRQAGKRNDVRGIVDRGTFPDCGYNARGYADDHRDEHSHYSQLDCHRQLVSDEFQNRLVGPQRNSEVSLQHGADPIKILRQDRLVEMILFPDKRQCLRVALFSRQNQCRISRKKFLQEKDKAPLNDYLWGKDVLTMITEHSRPPLKKTGLVAALQRLTGKNPVYPRFDAAVFVNYLKPLQARAYSIASSQAANDDEVHLTVADVVYQENSRQHQGACSVYLSERRAEQQNVHCWLLPNRYFSLPEDDNTPVIMIGPGTGIAPFIGFLQERKQRGASGKNWLFFGDRQRDKDFLYQQELEQFFSEGLLTRFDQAFSRDQADKVYVQDRLLEQQAEVYQWLEDGASVFVCGDAKRMAPDVEQALQTIIQQQGQKTEEAAEDYLKQLKKDQRYIKDVY